MNDPNLHGPLAPIEGRIERPIRREVLKDFSEIGESARLVGKAEFTIREWARHGRIGATWRKGGRAPHPLRVIGREELTRHRGDGLKPITTSDGRAAR